MNNVHLVSRRGFLERFLTAGALVLGAPLVPRILEAGEADNAPFHPSVYLGIEPDGSVIIVSHRSEMGTGIRSVLPTVAAEELNADWKRVKVEQGIGDKKYGSQNTDGSCSIRDFYIAFREAGATARVMLERAAAAKWSVPAAECHAKMHEVVHEPSGRKAGFGELVALAAQQPVPKKEELNFKSPTDYQYVGKELPTIDRDAICDGSAKFGMDAKMPGMVYASIERPPVLGGKLKSFDDAEVKKIPGVQTVALDGWKPPYGFQALGGVAVIADNTWAAMQARKKLKVEWDLGENAAYESGAYKKQLQETARKPGKVARNVGDVDAEFAKGTKVIEADYYVPHLAHAPMEPPVAVADFKDGKVTLWAPVQDPQTTQQTVARVLNLKPEDVTCNVTLLGGGFGRKSKPDFCAEAAVLSKQLGKPVKVVWTREDDIHFDYYHAVAAMYMKAGLDESGKPVAWLQRSVFPSIFSTFSQDVRSGSAMEMGMGFTDTPYALPNHRVENGEAVNHVRIGWLRSVANIYHAFGVCSFADELAHAANRDPKDYLLELIGPPRLVDLKAQGVDYPNMGPIEQYPVDTARLRKVIELVAEKSEWGKRKLPKGHALGIAAHRSFLSYIATVVEVAVSPAGKISIPRVDMAVDAGMIVNPDRVRSQFEGAAVFGASLALMGEVTATAGKIDQSNFHDYPVARMNEAPLATRVYIVESDAPPAGIGEPGVPPFAPALCNAIFAATGKRIRELPLSRQKLV